MDQDFTDESLREYLQQYLNTQIPITEKMGIQVQKCQRSSVVLKAPLKENTNDKNTAFAGSIYSLAVLSGWSLVHTSMKLEGFSSDQVISESSIKYIAPVQSDFTSSSFLVEPDLYSGFVDRIQSGKKGKIPVHVEIRDARGLCATFEGVYYAWKKGSV